MSSITCRSGSVSSRATTISSYRVAVEQFGVSEEVLVQLLAGSAACELDLDLIVSRPRKTDHVAGEIRDRHRGPHVNTYTAPFSPSAPARITSRLASGIVMK